MKFLGGKCVLILVVTIWPFVLVGLEMFLLFIRYCIFISSGGVIKLDAWLEVSLHLPEVSANLHLEPRRQLHMVYMAANLEKRYAGPNELTLLYGKCVVCDRMLSCKPRNWRLKRLCIINLYIKVVEPSINSIEFYNTSFSNFIWFTYFLIRSYFF